MGGSAFQSPVKQSVTSEQRSSSEQRSESIVEAGVEANGREGVTEASGRVQASARLSVGVVPTAAMTS